MALLWFLLGLLVGLGLLGWYHVRLNLKFKRLLAHLQPDVSGWPLSSTNRLMRTIVAIERTQTILVQDLDTWKHIFHTAPIGFLQVDEENQLILCNPQACQLLDVQQPLQPPRMLLEVVRSYELDQLIEQTRIAQKPHQRDWTFNPVSTDPSQLSRQSPRPLRAHSLPLSQYAVGVFLENRQEATLLAQQRDRWISDVAHELKTPLTSIRLVAETLQLRLDPPLRDWVDRLLKETIRLSSLVHDLLDLSQLEANPSPSLTLKTVDLAKLIQSTWLSLEPLTHRKQLQLDYAGPDRLLIQADESRLHRVLLNLLDNSIRYSPIQHSIQVRLTLTSGDHTYPTPAAHLEVIDWGPGFPEDALPFVFERFYRCDPSRSRSYADVEISSRSSSVKPAMPIGMTAANAPAPGTQSLLASSGSGLGLAIVRQIVEAHNGFVKAANHPDTHGAWLQVVLPCPDAEAARSDC